MLPLRVGNREAGGNAVTSSLTSNLLESFVSRKLARRVRGRGVGKVLSNLKTSQKSEIANQSREVKECILLYP